MARWILGLASLFVASTSVALAQSFDLPEPPQRGPKKILWSTRYYKHFAAAAPRGTGVQLRTRRGQQIDAYVSESDFCTGALEGTISIRSSEGTRTFNAAGLTKQSWAKCQFRGLSTKANDALGHQAWMPVTGNGELGLGVGGRRLVAFRTIAVDPKFIPLGSVLFIPGLRGFAFPGTNNVHDGYVLAGDVGGAIRGNHVDFFTGSYTGIVPAFIGSKSTQTFDAYLVTDSAIKSRLEQESRYIP